MSRTRASAIFALAACLLGAACSDSESPWQVREIATHADFRDVFFLDASHGWIVGGGTGIDGGILGETSDGGETWRFRSGIVPKVKSPLFSLNAVHFQDSERGLIVASGGRVLRTVDGGAHWHTLLHAGRVLSSLFFVDSRTGWAVGDEWVLRTEDGGQNWQRMNEHASPNSAFRARAAFFHDARLGWLVGHHGVIRRTRDAGRSWESPESVPDLGSVVLQSLFFSDSARGWIVGDEGCILHTRDGGRSWQTQQSGVDAQLNDVHFLDAGRGWIVGYDVSSGTSSVLHTKDGGENWIVEARIRGEALKALFFDAPDRAWAVGERVRREPQRLLRYAPPREP